MAPRAPKAPKPAKRPSWSIWRHKEKGWVTFYLENHLKSEYKWDPVTRERIEIPSKYTKDDFEDINPLEYSITATLKFTHLYTGRSAVNFEFTCLETGLGYSMLPREFERIMKIVDFHQGMVKGVWNFQKHGSSVGIYLVKEILDDEDESSNS